MAAFLAIALLTGFACAEDGAAQTMQPEAPVYAPQDMKPEEIGAFVGAMFAAAAGTTAEKETALREEMPDEEAEKRSAGYAEYRAKTIPWLTAVFKPVIPKEELGERPEATPVPETTPGPEELPVLPVYTTWDSFEAFGTTEEGLAFLELLKSMGGDSREMCLFISQEICGMWMAQVNHERLAGMNGDYHCWIYAPDTQIDYPVVEGKDNDYYLKRLFNGEQNPAGTLFIDYRNRPDFQDPNTLIYGHHMRNDSMFGSLTDYTQQAYFEGHPVMLVMTPGEVFLLEIFSGYNTSAKDHCYDIAIGDEEDMAAFVAEAVRKSEFASGVQVGPTDRLVTLSTCSYVFEDARFVLMGRIVPVWNEDMAMQAALQE